MRRWTTAGSQTGESAAPGQTFDMAILLMIGAFWWSWQWGLRLYSPCEKDIVRVLGMRCSRRRRGRARAPHRTPPSSTSFSLSSFSFCFSLKHEKWNGQKTVRIRAPCKTFESSTFCLIKFSFVLNETRKLVDQSHSPLVSTQWCSLRVTIRTAVFEEYASKPDWLKG